MAEPEKRCPKCGMPIPEGFARCPACTGMLREDMTPEAAPVSARNAFLRRNILIATAVVVVVALLVLLPRAANSSASRVPVEPVETQEDAAQETETVGKAPRPPVSTESNEPDTDPDAATVDNVVTAPGEDGHTHVYVQTVTRRASCTEAGVATYTCACGSTYTQPIAALGHDWRDATCTAPKTCARCGATEGAPLGHTPTPQGVCGRCGANVKEQEIAAENSRYEQKKADIEAQYSPYAYNNAIESHPDVIETERRLKDLREELALAENAGNPSDSDHLRGEINSLERAADMLRGSIKVSIDNQKAADLAAAEQTHQSNLASIEAKYS